MDLVLHWMQRHWQMVIPVVCAVMVMAVLRGIVQRQRAKAIRKVRLRTKEEQVKFNPVSTIYGAKQYRRPRK